MLVASSYACVCVCVAVQGDPLSRYVRSFAVCMCACEVFNECIVYINVCMHAFVCICECV